jgi:Nucleotidyl transferase AbiEii toxin, Type IV TA system
VLLPMRSPLVRAYPREASVAEKFHAMVELDIRNSRMKDFYDIWFLASNWTFDMGTLRKAIIATFDRRDSEVPKDVPFALTEGFLGDSQKKQQWTAFINRLDLASEAPSLEDVGALLQAFLLPCISRKSTDAQWWAPALEKWVAPEG